MRLRRASALCKIAVAGVGQFRAPRFAGMFDTVEQITNTKCFFANQRDQGKSWDDTFWGENGDGVKT